MKIEDIVKRLKKATNTSNNVELAKYFGSSKNMVSNWKATGKVPLKECLIVSKNENFSIEWLLTGKYSNDAHVVKKITKMYKNVVNSSNYKISPDMLSERMSEWYQAALEQDIDEDFIANGLLNYKVSDVVNEPQGSYSSNLDYAQVPVYDVQASAGHGSLVENEDQTGIVSLSTDYLYKIGVSRKDAAIIHVVGDSMEPTLSSNDLILIDMSVNSIVADGIYVIRVNDVVHVKRLQSNIDSSIEIISDNNVYKSFNVGTDELKIIAKVVLEFRTI